ncbi:hypothetical protein BCR36DRAFT_581705 [Piromyces finnis]|uniref:AMP-activated protein kinase glycogen-binding domain-containing protein n=1 Tax=Piromyces finnis TaxID=1754191 RepID=A0A1Y1VGD4_9FUNG|nr:hypothetical protein BCR36DRAFT_581705 [Piromyces finnis]|eukprot:ORX54822.1 hypothetical protein BCR36DRAFT_581705 [Piromyces finnis]
MTRNLVEYTITYSSASANSVKLVGKFGNWTGCIDMKKKTSEGDDDDCMNHYHSIVYVPKGCTIQYRFFVNNKHWGFDPYIASTIDDSGFRVNVAKV